MTRAFVGIGSNMRDSAGTVREAFDRLRSLGSNYVNSDLYLTQPWGKTDQPAFINAVASLDTTVEAIALLRSLQDIESKFGRQRTERWGPRTLDLDLLLFGDSVISQPGVTIPHPLLRARAFVLEPFAEIASESKVPPTGESIGGLRDSLSPLERESVRRLAGTAALRRPPRVDYDAPGGAGEHYETLRPFSRFDTAVLSAVLDAAGSLRGKRVLDIGCGTGRFTEKLAEFEAIVTGTDSSETMLGAARSRATQHSRPIDYVVGDADRTLPDGTYDAITAFYCVQYLDVDELAKRAQKHLNDRGTFAIASFPHRHFAETEYSRFFPSLAAIDMARFPSAQMIESALEKAGLVHIETREIALTIDDEPTALIERVERKYLSSFFLVPDREFREGIAAMRNEWHDCAIVRRTARAIVVSGRAPEAAVR